MTAAQTAARLAVLLAAGIPPGAAWSFATGEQTADVAASMRARGWAELATAWTVALAVGAPLAPALRGIARGLRDAEQAARDVDAALAGPIATSRLVLALPVVGLLFGLALGFDTVHTLFFTPLGWGCLTTGALLVAAAFAWNRAMVRRASRGDPLPGLGCDLIAVALGGGITPERATVLVRREATRNGLRIDLGSAAGALELSERAGVPAAELLRSAGEEARRAAASAAQSVAARLGVRLMLPLGLCVLPAFFLVGVVPLLATVLGATLAPSVLGG